MDDVPTAMTEADGLSHDDLAASIANNIDALPVGSVIAIQGAWGRGKTDVLTRVQRLFQERVIADAGVKPLWINPWQYGTPNLIAPLVTELLQRLEPEQRSGNPHLKEAAETLLRAGNAIAFKALSVFVPFGEILSGGQKPVDDLIGQLFSPGVAPTLPDADPVAVMARRFRDLIDEYLKITDSSGPVVICVDDLDRCLPDQQIAMLEAMHFLIGAKAEANFVVAIDPRLVQQAAVSHYSGSAFDVEQYLNKLFDLRVNLTALAGDLQMGFIASALRGRGRNAPGAAARLGLKEGELVRIWSETFSLPELSNPRLISRAVRRLDLYLARDPAPLDIPGLDDDSELTNYDRAAALVRLIAIAERWPDLRLLIQAMNPAMLREWLEKFCRYYGVGFEGGSEERAASLRNDMAEFPWLFDRLPDRKFHPDLGLFLERVLDLPELEKALDGFDQKLMTAGL